MRIVMTKMMTTLDSKKKKTMESTLALTSQVWRQRELASISTSC
jgi:hypothetical protein